MENKPKKSKALIITIIVLILLLIIGYLVFQNRDIFGVKTSATIAKIFSPLIPSNNSTDLTSVNQNGLCANGADNPPLCTTANGACLNGTTNSPLCTVNQNGLCSNGAGNPPLCTTANGVCLNGTTNSPLCTVNQNGLCANGADNPPLCTTANGVCKGGENNPPACTTISGTGLTGNICENGAVNPDACTLNPDGTCMNGAKNPDVCTLYNPGLPDLVAGSVTPINAIINKSTTLSSTITNIGSGSTGSSFTSFFTITTVSTGKSATANVVIPSLDVSVGNVAKTSYTFNATGDYSIRVCADKSSSSDAGTITESNERNNCGPWTTLTVTNSLPTEGDTCTNGADNPTLCTTLNGACVNGANNPPNCTITVCANGATNPPDCTALPPALYANECLLIDKNPLTSYFTDDEKSQLDELLRKFYLIAPNLKTEDDINIAYSTITQYQNFSEQLGVLINQCYLGTNDQAGYTEFCRLNPKSCSTIDKFNTTYTGPKTKYGNPWYKYSTSRGSYIDKTFDCKYVYGWFTGNGADGKNCDTYNQGLYSTPLAPASCTKTLNFSSNYSAGLNNKCIWNPGANIKEIEMISNVW